MKNKSILPKKYESLVEIYKSTILSLSKRSDVSNEELIKQAYIAGRQAGLNEASIYNYETKGFHEVPDVAIILQYKYILTALTED